jgi:hypothetical protein
MKKATDRRALALLPTSTRAQSRVVLFQPSKRPTRRTGGWQASEDGKRRVRVTGRLGQRHADLLEAICFTALAKRDVEGGGVDLIVDPYRVRCSMGAGRGKWGNYSKEQTQVLLTDLCGAVVEIKTPELEAQGYHVIGHLVDHWIPADPAECAVILPRTTIDPLTGGQRSLWCVRLGVALIALLHADAPLWGDPRPIAAMRLGVSQALVRHVRTHAFDPPGGWWLDTLLEAIGVAPGDDRRNARRGLRSDESVAELLAHGIVLDGDRVWRVQTATAGSVEASP